MTGREKILAALSPDGTPEFPAVICYDMLFIRDHYDQITSCPWWYLEDPDIAHQLAWVKDYIERTGLDWRYLPIFMPAAQREILKIEKVGTAVYRVNRQTGEKEELTPPIMGGSHQGAYTQSAHNPETPDQIRAIVSEPEEFDEGAFIRQGRADLAKAVLAGPGKGLFGIQHVVSPLTGCFHLWGFEEGMVKIATRPDLIKCAAEQYLAGAQQSVRRAAACGVHGIWIEETMTDMISPAAFTELNVPLITRLVAGIRQAGLKSIYYYCGNPAGRLELMLSTGTDAIALEESKKGFTIDIEQVAQTIRGRCALLGNLDAIGLLEHGSEEELKAESRRQIAAGRKNKNRFIMSTGSPVTPGTPAERVRLYADLVHELGN